MVECPFRIHVGTDTFLDNNLTLAELAGLLERRKGSYPKTSAPSPGDFVEAFKASQKRDGVLVVTIGSSYSTTHSAAVLAKDLFHKEMASSLPIEVVDSHGGTMTQGFLIMEAYRLITTGESLQLVAAKLRVLARLDNLVFALRETTYLYRSGRAKSVQHLLASVLRFKPVLALKGGSLQLLQRVRGDETNALLRVAEEVVERSGGKINTLAIIGGLGTEVQEEIVRKEILSPLPTPPFQVFHAKMCPAIMINVGPHGVGAAWV